MKSISQCDQIFYGYRSGIWAFGEELSTAEENDITEEEYSQLVEEEGSSSTEIDLSSVATPDSIRFFLLYGHTSVDDRRN